MLLQKTFPAALLISLILVSCSSPTPTASTATITHHRIDWVRQVDSLIMPFWISPEALGDPIGNFPAYRYSDGTPIDPERVDYQKLDPLYTHYYFTATDSMRRDFVRTKSRQIYGLCMAYHMTGNEQYLLYAKKALELLIAQGVFEEPLPFSFRDRNGKPAPALFQRNPQDISYALMGPTMYYYLTRDSEILDLILRAHNFLWEEYYEKSDVRENTKLVQWVREDFENDRADSKQLLAPLDILNAYLLVLAKSAPDPVADTLRQQAGILAHMIKDNFYDPKYNIFWSELGKMEFGGNTDFPHSIKSFWMILTTGKMTADFELMNFALEGAPRLLDTAWIPEKGRWAMRYNNGEYEKDLGIFTWAYNELDQMTATLSLEDTSYYSRFLHEAYANYEKLLIDPINKGAYVALDADDKVLDVGYRAEWFLANFHVMEHAFIGQLADAHYHDEPLILYFAFKDDQRLSFNRIQPYTYIARVDTKEEGDFEDRQLERFRRTTVTFGNIR